MVVHQADHEAGAGADRGQATIEIRLEQHRVDDVRLVVSRIRCRSDRRIRSRRIDPMSVDLEALRAQQWLDPFVSRLRT